MSCDAARPHGQPHIQREGTVARDLGRLATASSPGHEAIERSAAQGQRAGGYVGDGVGTSNLAGRTLADLVLERDSELVTLPWVNHRSRTWEPEPLRWLGINAGLRAMRLADWEEQRTRRPSVVARAMAPLIHG